MAGKTDIKKEWPKIKKQLLEMSQEALVLAKKGEEQIVEFSKKGKLQLDSATVKVKKESLYHKIGKAYVRSKCPGEKSATMKKLLEELKALNTAEKGLKRKIKAKK